MTRFAAIILTILTGFSGLVYEVAWQKYLATLLGSHGEATAATLAIFLGGLSVGYSLFGRATRRLVERSRQRRKLPRLLLFYGLIEAGIGVYALLFPLLFGVAQKFSLLIPIDTAGFAFGFDVLLSALLIGPPAVLMGGTIPILTLGLAGSRERATRVHALIYGCNTLGAFIGALASAFILIPRLGLDGVLYAMGSLNIIAGFIFLLIDRFGERVAPDLEHGPPVTTGSIERFRVYAAVALLAGFAMMALQTTFNRIGALAFGSSHFTFAIVVAVFVLCIALGSFAVSQFRNIPRIAIAITQWALVIYLLVLYQHVENAPYWAHTIRVMFRDLDQVFYPFYIASFACIFLVLVIPIGLSGALLPLLFHHLRGEVGDLGSVAGRLYSWNTVGSLLGALFGGYVLLFWLDLHHIYRLALAALLLESALLTGLLLRISNRMVIALVLLPALIGFYALPDWAPERLSAGLFRRRTPQPTSFSGPDAHFGTKNRNVVIDYNDGPTATVTVRERTGKAPRPDRSIYVNGKSDGNLIADYPTMSLLALIPALMAEKVERCFVIGFGTGVSTGELAALEWVQEVDVAEISQAVIEAAPLFDKGNLGASKNPKVTIRRGDAYRTLMRSDGKYDVIVSEPSNPWVTGVEMLYSIEFLEAARSHLSRGGVYAQWMHLYALDAETIELVLRNYTEVFPHVSVWITQPRDLVLLGFDTPERALDLATIEARFERVDFAAGLKRAGVESIPALLAHELLPLGVLHASDLDGPFHTLRHPRLSDLAARAFLTGNNTTLPKFPTPEGAEVGTQNSLLRRYVGEKGPLPEEISEAAVRVTCALQLVECTTLLADWRRVDPRSEALNALIEEFRSHPALAGLVAREKLAALERLFGGRTLITLEGPRSLARAKRLSGLYLTYYHHAVPFDREMLRVAWGNCSARGCESAQHRVERQLGKIDAPRQSAVSRRRIRAGSPVPNEETESTDRLHLPASG
ncbi:MAG: fused MFS/spermidine synthase [Myxococcales bacterium]|nr:fused MFS/spermidine synthase [Myxococcales bacterium]